MRLQKFNRTLLGAMLVSGALGMASQAHALTLTPFVAPDNVTTWGSTQLANLSESALETLVGAASGSLGLVYKQDFGGVESGNGAPYYTTAFVNDNVSNVAGDTSGATITWDGGLIISCPTCYLVVKDGNHSQTPPPWPQYVYSLGNWNGTDTITLSGFWPGPGAISNIAIWNSAGGGGGGTVASIPEPETYAMLLAGLGLVGFATRRKLS